MKRVSLPVAITIGCGLIFLGLAASFLVKKGNLNRGNKPEPKETIKRTDYTDVARKTLDWIDQQRNEEGWYILERGCDYEKKTCDIVWDNKEGNKDGLIATWARLNFFEQHQDPKDLEIVKKDIDLFFDKYKDDNLSDSLWLCKITYEMAQSKYINQTQKDKLKELCMKVEYPGVEEVRENNIDRLSKFKGSKVWEDWKSYQLVVRGFNSDFGLVTEMVFRFKWTNDKDYLNQAKQYLDTLKDIVDRDDIFKVNNMCLLGISSLDFYEINREDEANMKYVDDIYEAGINNKASRKQYQTSICGYLVTELYKITGDKNYWIGLENNNNVLVKNLRDDGASFANLITNGGFFKTTTGGFDVLFKNVAENGLIVELLRN